MILRGERAEIEATLQANTSVKKLIALDSDGDDVVLRVSMAEDVREALVAALVEKGIGVRGVANAHDELEGIFLDLARLEGEA